MEYLTTGNMTAPPNPNAPAPPKPPKKPMPDRTAAQREAARRAYGRP